MIFDLDLEQYDMDSSEWKNTYPSLLSPAIMESMHGTSILIPSEKTGKSWKINNSKSENQVASSAPASSINLPFHELKVEKSTENIPKSFLLLDEHELLKITCSEEFLRMLGCDDSTKVKVVSIFGNTGDGKSHTLNHCFFKGRPVFRTSTEQDSCTVGVWIAYDPHSNVLCLDTEGLLGCTSNENQRTRLLLKVLAISDVLIYRTRSERLHRDLFTFLGTASRSYTKHFHAALQVLFQKAEFCGNLSSLGPSVIIFHETRHTNVLQATKTESKEDILRSRFSQLHLDIDAFSSLRYVGVRTSLWASTDFEDLKNAIAFELENTTVRSARSPSIVFHTLKGINEKFSGEIVEQNMSVLFPDQYFSCSVVCLACNSKCTQSMGHSNDGTPHNNESKCKYQHQYSNCVYICKACHLNGQEVEVTPKYTASSESPWYSFAKYAWSGYLIECPNHGEIYRSRQFWYGNSNPDMTAVRTEIRHCWPDGKCGSHIMQNSAQKIIDSVSYLTEAVSCVSVEPSRYLSSWVADQIAPSYWQPNASIRECSVCETAFESDVTKHHCRACGKGVCDACSTHRMPVPERNWSYDVRVCDNCADAVKRIEDSAGDAEIRVRKVGEAVASTLSTVASVLDYPKSFIKESARPTYWRPDDQVKCCNVCVCDLTSGTVRLHHCRDCGEGVCSACSQARLPVPQKGWDYPVRVCDHCAKNK